MTEDESAYGIVAAHLEDDAGRNLLELRGVPIRSTLQPGTVVWSSGVGGVFPRGIPIGTIVGEAKNPAEVWARTYIVKPAVNPAQVDAVMVLSPERGEDSLKNVWSSPEAVQQTVRQIVRTGDSLARRRVADSAAAVARRQPPAATPDSAAAVRDAVRPAAAAPTPVRRPASTDTSRRDSTQRPRPAAADSTRLDTAGRPRPAAADSTRPDTTPRPRPAAADSTRPDSAQRPPRR
jgi:rod shape-determining protein MreC